MTPRSVTPPPEMGEPLDLILIGQPDLSDSEIHDAFIKVCPKWCHLGYRSHQQAEAHPALPAPVLVWHSDQKINDLLVRNNRLVFVMLDTSEIIKTIWQLRDYKGKASLVSPYNSEILGGHFIHAIPELVSILLEGGW